MTTTTSYDIYNSDFTALYAAMGYFMLFMMIFFLAYTIVMIVSMWKIYQKAGKEGWEAIVPIYNIVVLFQIVGLNPWLVVLFFIPVVNFFAPIILYALSSYKLATAFNKDIGYALGLFFLPIIFFPMLAFGSAKYTLNAVYDNALPTEPQYQTEMAPEPMVESTVQQPIAPPPTTVNIFAKPEQPPVEQKNDQNNTGL